LVSEESNPSTNNDERPDLVDSRVKTDLLSSDCYRKQKKIEDVIRGSKTSPESHQQTVHQDVEKSGRAPREVVRKGYYTTVFYKNHDEYRAANPSGVDPVNQHIEVTHYSKDSNDSDTMYHKSSNNNNYSEDEYEANLTTGNRLPIQEKNNDALVHVDSKIINQNPDLEEGKEYPVQKPRFPRHWRLAKAVHPRWNRTSLETSVPKHGDGPTKAGHLPKATATNPS
jgi:hypothetical protein